MFDWEHPTACRHPPCSSSTGSVLLVPIHRVPVPLGASFCLSPSTMFQFHWERPSACPHPPCSSSTGSVLLLVPIHRVPVPLGASFCLSPSTVFQFHWERPYASRHPQCSSSTGSVLLLVPIHRFNVCSSSNTSTRAMTCLTMRRVRGTTTGRGWECCILKANVEIP